MDSNTTEDNASGYGQAVSSNIITMTLRSPHNSVSAPYSRAHTRAASINSQMPPRSPRSHRTSVHSGSQLSGIEGRFRGHFSGPFVAKPPVQQKDMRPYFRSRRIQKGTVDRPELRTKDPRWIWMNIVPVVGILLGFGIVTVLAYLGYRSVVNHTYCLVFTDDFSGGIDPSIWQYEIQTGGYEYVSLFPFFLNSNTNHILTP